MDLLFGSVQGSARATEAEGSYILIQKFWFVYDPSLIWSSGALELGCALGVGRAPGIAVAFPLGWRRLQRPTRPIQAALSVTAALTSLRHTLQQTACTEVGFCSYYTVPYSNNTVLYYPILYYTKHGAFFKLRSRSSAGLDRRY